MPPSRSSSCWAASIPSEDGQELGAEEVAEAMARAQAATAEPPALRPSITSEAQGPCDGRRCGRRVYEGRSELPPPNTSMLAKSVFESEDAIDDLEGREVRVVKAQRGDTLTRILQRMGAETWQARAMNDAARNGLPEGALQAGPGGARDAGALGGARQPHGARSASACSARPRITR